MSDRTCSGCEHWDTAADLYHFENEFISREDRDGTNEEDFVAAANRAKERLSLWGECRAIKQKESAADDAVAMLSDGSGYYAALATRGSFGCLLFTERSREGDAE